MGVGGRDWTVECPELEKVLLSPGQDTGGADSGALIWREAVLIVLKALIALLELIRQFIE